MNNSNDNKINILFMYICCMKYKEKWNKIKFLNKGKNIPFVILCGKNMDKDFELIDNVLYLNCDDAYEGLPEKVSCGLDAILRIPKFSNITHIIKIDDDNTCNPSDVNNFLVNSSKNILNSYDYIGQNIINHKILNKMMLNKKLWKKNNPNRPKFPHPREWHFGKVNKNCYWYNKKYDGPFVSWADGGSSYILSRKAALLITNENNFNNLNDIRKKAIYEDLFIAVTLEKHNIIPFKYNFLIKGDKPY